VKSNRITTLSLVAHDLRLARRDLRFGSRRQRRIVLTLLFIVVAFLHLVGWVSADRFSGWHQGGGLPVVAMILAGVTALCFSNALSGMIDAMRDAGDLELLVCSPLPPRIVLRARLLAIATKAAFLPMVAAVPMVNGMLLHGTVDWLGTYPTLLSLAVIASVIAGFGFLSLLAIIGPQRARIAARVIATVFGALAFLATQTSLILPAHFRANLWNAIKPAEGNHPGGLLWIPAHAMYGDWGDQLIMIALAIGLLMFVTAIFEPLYGTGVIAILNADRGGRAPRPPRFGGSLSQVLFTKEMRLFFRQPGLLIQIAYQFVFLIPASMVVMRMGSTMSASASVLFITVMMTGRISSVFQGVVIRKDTAGELALTAPINYGQVNRIKNSVLASAVFIVTAPLLLLIAFMLPKALPVILTATLGSILTRFALERRRPQLVRAGAMHGRVTLSSNALLGALIDIIWAIGGALVLAH